MLFCPPVASDALACSLFTYHGHVVALDLVGAGIPILVSVLFCVILLRRMNWRISPGLTVRYVAYAVILSLVAAVEFTLWDMFFGGISIQTQFFLFTVVFPAGAIQFVLFDRGSKQAVSVMKPYIVGSTSIVVSDLVRTLTGWLTVSPQIIGGSGPYDGVFLCGLFMAITYLFSAAIYLGIRKNKVVGGIHAGKESEGSEARS